jgi:hypothetical protein
MHGNGDLLFFMSPHIHMKNPDAILRSSYLILVLMFLFVCALLICDMRAPRLVFWWADSTRLLDDYFFQQMYSLMHQEKLTSHSFHHLCLLHFSGVGDGDVAG